MERQVTEQQPLSLGDKKVVPVQEYAVKKSLGRHAVGRYVEPDQIETVKVEDETSVIDVPAKPETTQKTSDLPANGTQTESVTKIIQAAKVDWIHFGIIQAQAKSKTRWQTYAFALTVFFIGVLLADIWLYMDRAIYAKQLEDTMEELGAAKMKLTVTKADLDRVIQLEAENSQLISDNAALKAQNALLLSQVESFEESTRNSVSKPISTTQAPQVEPLNQWEKDTFSNQADKSMTPELQKNGRVAINQEKKSESPTETLSPKVEAKPAKDQFDESQKNEQETLRLEKEKRINDIQKGLYPKNMTKDELITSLGKPDRTYKGAIYEQLVYFNQPSRRFWFRNGPFVERIE